MAGKKIFGIRIMHVEPPMAPGKRYGKQSVKRWEPVLKPGSLKKALEEKAALAREQNQLERRLKTFKTAALPGSSRHRAVKLARTEIDKYA